MNVGILAMEIKLRSISALGYGCLVVSGMGATPLCAADYYVSPGGDDGQPGIESTPWGTIVKANKTLRPGDTVYLMGGEYRERIEPARSGSAGHYITYRAYDEHHPVITSPPGKIAIALDNRSYIRIDGLTFDGKYPYKQATINKWAEVIDSHHNIFQNSQFYYAKGWTAFHLERSHYNKFINNRMDYVGTFFDDDNAEGMGDMIALRCANHNLIEGNTLTRAGHDLLTVSGDYNVIRNNVFENKWGPNEGYRAISLSANRRFCNTTRGFNLFEHNIVKNSLLAHADFRGSSADKEPPAMKVEGANQIVRYNIFANNVGPAISGSIRPPKIMEVQDNRIYNNVVYQGGGLWMMRDYGNEGPASNNYLKNNIIYASEAESEVFINFSSGGRTALENNYFISNAFSRPGGDGKIDIKGLGTKSLFWVEENIANFNNNVTAPPQFESVDSHGPDRFHLDRHSPMIDAGDFLTKTSGSGSGRRIAVSDANWFTAGFGVVDGDLVQVGNNLPVRVTNVDYAEGVLTVDSPISWDSGQNVSLPYVGGAPDIGAFERRK